MAWLNIAVLVLAAICVLAALVSILSGLQTRGAVSNAPYGVARQESRRSMQIAFIRAAILGIVALILFGVYGLSATPEDMLSTEPPETEEPLFTPTTGATQVAATATATSVTLPQGTSPPPATATATQAAQVTEVVPTATATSIPTITPTSAPSAVVNSEVGLYLRPEPGSTVELELLPDGTELLLLSGRETVDDLEWQEVRSPSGNEGWVAVDFITYQQ